MQAELRCGVLRRVALRNQWWKLETMRKRVFCCCWPVGHQARSAATVTVGLLRNLRSRRSHNEWMNYTDNVHAGIFLWEWWAKHRQLSENVVERFIQSRVTWVMGQRKWPTISSEYHRNGVGHSKARPAPHFRVLSRGEFNDVTVEPLRICSDSFFYHNRSHVENWNGNKGPNKETNEQTQEEGKQSKNNTLTSK